MTIPKPRTIFFQRLIRTNSESARANGSDAGRDGISGTTIEEKCDALGRESDVILSETTGNVFIACSVFTDTLV